MTHYMMVAKLSNRCFALVVKIAESRQAKVTQSDFLDLYSKKESEQHTLLLDLLEGRVAFEDLRKQRVCVSLSICSFLSHYNSYVGMILNDMLSLFQRAAKNVTRTSRSENDYKEVCSASEVEKTENIRDPISGLVKVYIL